MSTPSIFEIQQNAETIIARDEVKKEMEEYDKLFQGTDTYEKRKSNYMTMVNNFYDLVTDFYEYGWGESFHFAPRFKGETFTESIARSEHFIASRLGLRPGMKAIDIGCGVGGPLRTIARFSGAHVTGLNNNAYQIKRATKKTNSMGLSKQADFIKSDFMNISAEDNTFDAAYAIEATCHAPDKVGCFSEIYRILKPGALFCCYEWCMTDQYDPKNAEHRAIKEGIELGNGLPDIATIPAVLEAVKKAGFELVEEFDHHKTLHSPNEIPWYEPLHGTFSLQGFRHTQLGRTSTHFCVNYLEKFGLAPAGTTRVHEMLSLTAQDLVRGGQLQIFTPDYYFLARKPLN